MSIDPELKPFLDLLQEQGLPDLATTSAAELRTVMTGIPVEHPTAVASVTDRVATGDVPVRVYQPQGKGPFPLLVFYHGGGWVVGDLDTHDELCRQLCAQAQAVVVSVQYRLAPEAPFPAAPEDCYAATCWAVANAAELQASDSQVMVAGDSAGGNLAAAVTLLARERGTPTISRQLLMYPVTDFSFETASYRDNSEGYYLTREMMQWFWGHYLQDPAHGSDPLASPLHADLTGLPPAAVITAGYDPLRDEGAAYAGALEVAGVDVELRNFPGMIHGFMTMPGLTQAGHAISWLCEQAQRRS